MTIIIILAVLALFLALLEVLVFPGFGITGIGSIVCAIVDVVLVYNEYGVTGAIIAIAAALVALAVILRWVAKSKTFERMALHSTISSTNATEAQLSVKVGDEGKALTRLALIGNAEIAGKQVEVKSSGAFINPGCPIRVVNVSEATIVVEAMTQD